MNTYHVTGVYRCWDDSKHPDTPFERVVEAESVREAVELVEHRYRDAEIKAVALRDSCLLVAGGL
jgi:hypothetical protein